MAVKNFSFKVDFITKNSLCMAHVKQNDNAIFNIYLTAQGQALDLTGQQVRLFVRKPDGKLVVQENDIAITDAKGGAIKVTVQNSIFQAVGVAVCEIDVWGTDENNASSGSFLINIDEQLGSNDVVESYVDVNLFRQLTEYIDEANADILKYKTLFEGFVEAGVSLEGLNDIKAYIDNNLADLKAQGDRAVDLIPKVDKASTDAEAKRVEVVNVTATAEAKRVDVVNATNTAEAKRIEVVNATNTANTSKDNLVTATTNGDNKKKELETATANAETKRAEVVAVTNTANTSKTALQTATADANTKKGEVLTATADAEKKRVEVVNATNTANSSKTALDGSIASGNSVKAGLDGSISTGNSLKAGLDASITSGNSTKTALDSATSSANTKKGEVETATSNAEAKRIQVVAVTDSAEAKRKELQEVVDNVGTLNLVSESQMNSALAGKLDKTAHLKDLTSEETVTDADSFESGKMWVSRSKDTMVNCPIEYSTVVNFGAGSNSNGQLAWNYDGDVLHLFFRKRQDTSGTYGKWEQMYHTGHKPTLAELGAMGMKKLDTDGGEYYGMTAPDGDDVPWLRTTKMGIIPYQSGVNSISSLGTDAWRFHEVWADYFKGRRLDLTEYGKTLTVGAGESDCFMVNSKANKYLQLKDDGRLCYNDVNLVLTNQSETLWEGVYYLFGSQSVFPSKPLSKCRGGWVLVWSDYDPTPGASNDYNFAYTYIPKNASKYFNKNTDILIPINEVDKPIVKALYFNDGGFSGNDSNTTNGADDVVLRAVLEY